MEFRILSLLPAATEIVYLLGLQESLVGVSHECDYPSKAKLKPRVTSSPISNNLSSLEINTQVAKLRHKGSGVFHISEEILKNLRPNLILTQELCDICAISWTEVKKAAKVLDANVKIISLEPESIGDILENILLVGKICDRKKKAIKIVDDLKGRLGMVELRLSRFARNDDKRVLVIEWLEPIMNAGHWVPEMVERAGGVSVKMNNGHKSYPITLEQIVKADPNVVIFAPCGFNIVRTLSEKYLIEDLVKKIDNEKVKYFLMDGNAYLTRPGPRIIEGVEILAEILHPEVFEREHNELDWRNL